VRLVTKARRTRSLLEARALSTTCYQALRACCTDASWSAGSGSPAKAKSESRSSVRSTGQAGQVPGQAGTGTGGTGARVLRKPGQVPEY
jgi:hypothetical protein